MASKKEPKPFRLNGTDAELKQALFDREIPVPVNEDTTLDHAEAVRLLQNWKKDFEKDDAGRHCRVVFHASSNPSAGPYVFASMNNLTYQIPYEKEVVVPEVILRECIDRAKVKDLRITQDEYGRSVTAERNIPVYPYTFICYEDKAVEE